MKIIFILLLSVVSTLTFSQIERPVCDDVTEIPYSFSYSGFLLQENSNEGIVDNSEASTMQLVLNISTVQPQGEVIYTERFTLPINFNGFFSLELGTNNIPYFMDFIAFLNQNSDTEYYFDLYRAPDEDFTEFKYLGSKKILTVPYAYVANSINGMGPRGEPGVSGVQGLVGMQGSAGAPSTPGDQGQDGECDFGAMPWTNSPPIGSRVYIDDGTNTSDGLPHIRLFVNGQWLDL